ncbi:MAG: pyridoxamine 5'-phosphate oxidase family protein [Actinomycetota bacterium]|nr:pyridoxamine 5'-phosphate oxidase family protein [Actinomycetota bacterium]
MELDRNGLEVLNRDDSLRLLETTTLGRLGLTSGALPTVLPVNFRLDGDRILIRTGAGSKLSAATRNAVVAFEADCFDPADQSGWSVVVTGVAREVTDPAELARLSAVAIPRWAPHGDGRVVAISTELVSGRRLLPNHAAEEVAA